MNIFEPQGKDEIYRYIQNEINDPCKEVKKLIQQLYPPAQQYLDPDFCKALANDFNSHFWELYLVSVFLDLEFTLIPKKKSLSPDICISIDDQQSVWVEAVGRSILVFRLFSPGKAALRAAIVVLSRLRVCRSSWAGAAAMLGESRHPQNDRCDR